MVARAVSRAVILCSLRLMMVPSVSLFLIDSGCIRIFRPRRRLDELKSSLRTLQPRHYAAVGLLKYAHYLGLELHGALAEYRVFRQLQLHRVALPHRRRQDLGLALAPRH